MGCPDAVRAELLNLPGMLEVNYQVDQGVFLVRFESVLLPLETIVTALVVAGKKMGQDYLPEVIG